MEQSDLAGIFSLKTSQVALRKWNLYFPGAAEVTGRVLQLLSVHHSNFIVTLSFLRMKKKPIRKPVAVEFASHQQV